MDLGSRLVLKVVDQPALGAFGRDGVFVRVMLLGE
jgi:hypothetical protein